MGTETANGNSRRLHAETGRMTLDSLFRRFAFAPLPVPQDWFAIPLRLIVGYGFLAHGYAKLARGPDDFIAILHAIGTPFAFFLGWATIIIEVVGGLLILVGACVPLASVPMIVVLLVAIFTVHLPNGFSSIKLIGYDGRGAFGQPGYEPTCSICGSAHALLRRRRSRWMVCQRAGWLIARHMKPPFAGRPPGWRGARPPNSPSPPPSETRRAPPTANRR